MKLLTPKQLDVYHIKNIIDATLDIASLLKKGEVIDEDTVRDRYYQTIASVCIIQINNLLDEWDKAREIDELKAQIAPLIREIRSFKDIKDFRNGLLAHAYDFKKLLINDSNPKEYNVPANPIELTYVIRLLEILEMVLINTYRDEIDVIDDFVKDVNGKISFKTRFETKEQMADALRALLTTLEERSSERNEV